MLLVVVAMVDRLPFPFQPLHGHPPHSLPFPQGSPRTMIPCGLLSVVEQGSLRRCVISGKTALPRMMEHLFGCCVDDRTRKSNSLFVNPGQLVFRDCGRFLAVQFFASDKLLDETVVLVFSSHVVFCCSRSFQGIWLAWLGLASHVMYSSSDQVS
jgi:hypothetical protein